MGLSEAEVVDDEGRLVAHSTSRMRIFGDRSAGAPTRGGTAAPPAAVETATAQDDGPDPFLRPLEGAIDQDGARGMRGIDVVRAQIRGDLPLPPLHHLIGITPTEAKDGAAACACRSAAGSRRHSAGRREASWSCCAT